MSYALRINIPLNIYNILCIFIVALIMETPQNVTKKKQFYCVNYIIRMITVYLKNIKT
jgi:hypothetical protein